MKNLICPVSALRVNENVVRVVALIVVALVALYLYTGSVYWLLFLGLDFYIRAFTNLKYSPVSWLARQITELFGLPETIIDKAPKIFAARVGLLFTVAMVILFYIHPPSSIIVGLVLVGFALLEAVFNLCVGCLVYTYVVFPWFKPV